MRTGVLFNFLTGIEVTNFTVIYIYAHILLDVKTGTDADAVYSQQHFNGIVPLDESHLKVDIFLRKYLIVIK